MIFFVIRAGLQYYQQNRLVSEWQKAGAIVIFDDDTDEVTLIADMGPGRFKVDRLQNLPKTPHLSHLLLSETSINDDDLDWIGSLNSLESLALNDTSISDQGVLHLRDLTSLRHLHLSNTSITDASVTVLGGLVDLKELDISGTLITPQGQQLIERMLPQADVIGTATNPIKTE
ncbi:leucine-rich repeat domain-containing protein [Aeoliella straminimaris]|nr:leucine-rich repeat domain-containing protein [Aeoliella straminimaris]